MLPDSWIDAEYNRKHGLPADTKNTLKNYKRLGDVISDGRLAGMIDWDAIEDRTRNLLSSPHWSSPRSSCGPVPINMPWTCGPGKKTTSKSGSRKRP